MAFAWRDKLAGAALAVAFALLLLFATLALTENVQWMGEIPTDEKLATIASMSNPSRLSVPDGDLLAPFLVPRVSGTPGNVKVRTFIVDHFQKLGWQVQVDNFTDPSTPHGKVEFANVIATKSPTARRRLVLAAHFDSKYFPPPNEDKFIGATDSAVPCAILLDLAFTLNSLLDAHAADQTLQMIFFDGEEAFVQWTDTDSLYGSRHLAAQWGSTFVMSSDDTQTSPVSLLDTIDVFILLDLLGASNPSLPNLQPPTTHYYEALKESEESLLAAGQLVSHASQIGNVGAASSGVNASVAGPAHVAYFNEGRTAHVEDDHWPFLQRGVPIVHLINFPFPRVWHELTDNADAIDPTAVYNLNLIFRVFLTRYFGLKV